MDKNTIKLGAIAVVLFFLRSTWVCETKWLLDKLQTSNDTIYSLNGMYELDNVILELTIFILLMISKLHQMGVGWEYMKDWNLYQIMLTRQIHYIKDCSVYAVLCLFFVSTLV